MNTVEVHATNILGTDCSFNVTGRGEYVTTLRGQFIAVTKSEDHFGADAIYVGNTAYAIRDVISMGLRGKNGIEAVHTARHDLIKY